MKVKTLTKHLINIILIIGMVVIVSPSADAWETYDNYTYSVYGIPSAEPAAFIADGLATGKTAGTKEFNAPKDMCIGPDGRIYIADSGNNRIVILDKTFTFLYSIDRFSYQDVEYSFNNPNGVFVTEDNELYVADTDNFRVVVFDENFNPTGIFQNPAADSLEIQLEFVPVKIAVDKYKRCYVVSRGNTDGLIQLDHDGSFIKYYGAIVTSPSLLDIFWRKFMTKEQRARITLNVPTVYSNVSIDEGGFVYASVSATGGVFNPSIMVRRINSMGVDILRRDGFFPPQGDVKLKYDSESNSNLTSKFADVCVRENGMYGVLDVNMGRVFTYDYYGRLQYVFGGYGEQVGAFGNPTALCFTEDDRYLVLDSKFNQIALFKKTRYAQKIDEATALQFARNYEEAQKVWGELAKLSSRSALIYDGLGRMAIKNLDYNEAMIYFKLADNRAFYSEAFGYYRKEFMSVNFSRMISLAIGAVLSIFLIKAIIRIIGRRNKNGQD
ncbi:MAG: hypothetical protein ACYCYM_09620 [Saccharofermentanales bacterium]